MGVPPLTSRWNTRFSAGFRRLASDRASEGVSWGHDERDAPLPYSAIDPRDFLELVRRHEEETGEPVLPPEPPKGRAKGKAKAGSEPTPFTAEEFVAYERRLAEHYGDDQVAYHLSRLAFRMGPQYYDVFTHLPKGFLDIIWEWLFPEAACWRMTGEMSVGVVFVESGKSYGHEWHAYASGGRITLARRNNWGGWGRSVIDRIAAHETSHLFGSADEYTGSGTPCSSCGTTHGCDHIPNGNCGACAQPRQGCVMDANTQRLCGYTRGQIGWSDLFVVLGTADELWAGTDDDVWIDIGDHSFVLDTPDFDDRERGQVEGYPIWAPWLRREDVRRVLIRKSPDGWFGGWKLARARVWFRVELMCDARPNRWLEDDHRWWVGCINDRALVNTLRVKVTTADVAWAGTDDDVTLTLGGHSWDLDKPWHDDFERGNTDTFDLDPRTGFRVGDIHSLRIHKSPDGFAGGWKLKGVEVIVNGSTIYSNQSINRWLEDDDRTWGASI